VPPLPSQSRAASRLPDPSQAAPSWTEPRKGEPQHAAIRHEIRHAPIRQAKILWCKSYALAPADRAGQTAGIDPERKVVATDPMSRIDVDRTFVSALGRPVPQFASEMWSDCLHKRQNHAATKSL
jgi:hypothetical protein